MKLMHCPVGVPFRLPGYPLAKGRSFVIKERKTSGYQQAFDDQGKEWVIGPDMEVEIIKQDDDDIMP